MYMRSCFFMIYGGSCYVAILKDLDAIKSNDLYSHHNNENVGAIFKQRRCFYGAHWLIKSNTFGFKL